MILFCHTDMRNQTEKIINVDAEFENGCHLLHFCNIESLQLWTETLTGICPPAHGEWKTDQKRIGLIAPCFASTEQQIINRFKELAETRCYCAVFNLISPKLEEKSIQQIQSFCLHYELVFINCILEPQASALYDHLWQVKHHRLQRIR